MSILTVQEVVAELGRTPIPFDHREGENGVSALCPLCKVKQMAWWEGGCGWVCDGGCDSGRIADRVNSLAGYHLDPRPEAATKRAATVSLLSFQDLLAQPDPEYLIDGLVPAVGQSVIYGASGTFKSFLALDWAMFVAAGLPWNGHQVKQRRVVYIAAEGLAGLKARALAWSEANGRPDLSRIHWLPEALDLRDSRQVDAVREAFALLPEPPGLVVVDTMARTMPGGDENSARDVGEFVANVDALRDGGASLIVHHTGHDGEHERGSSALRAAADLRVKVKRHGQGPLAEVTCTKLKDGEEWEPITLRIEPQDTGSCVLRPVLPTESQATRSDEIQAGVLEVVRNEAPIGKSHVRKAVKGKNLAIDKALATLVDDGLIEVTGTGYQPCPEAGGTLGHALPAAAFEDRAPEGGKTPVGGPPRGTLQEPCPITVPQPDGAYLEGDGSEAA